MNEGLPGETLRVSPRARIARDRRLGRAGGGDPFATAERLQVATCADWLAATVADRFGAAQSIRAIIAGSRGDGLTLDGRDGYRALDRPCRSKFAGGFLLYELYARAVGFAGRSAP